MCRSGLAEGTMAYGPINYPAVQMKAATFAPVPFFTVNG